MKVEKSMKLRRKRIHNELLVNEIAPSLSCFPMMGVNNYPHTKNNYGSISNSKYISDEVINPHPRFGALTSNIRNRRKSNVNIQILKDTNPNDHTTTTSDIITSTTTSNVGINNIDNKVDTENKVDSQVIHMDAMAFGMGCCCLQVTIQAQDEEESRYLTDQLSILSPILHALSASTPILKGQFASTDTRWDVISQAVDDRTIDEYNNNNKYYNQSLHSNDNDNTYISNNTTITSSTTNTCTEDIDIVGNGTRYLSQSRYSQVPLYINKPRDHYDIETLNKLNDLDDVAIDNTSYDMLIKDNKVDVVLARYIAHLFTRDPLVIFDDLINIDNNKTLVTYLYIFFSLYIVYILIYIVIY